MYQRLQVNSFSLFSPKCWLLKWWWEGWYATSWYFFFASGSIHLMRMMWSLMSRCELVILDLETGSSPLLFQVWTEVNQEDVVSPSIWLLIFVFLSGPSSLMKDVGTVLNEKAAGGKWNGGREKEFERGRERRNSLQVSLECRKNSGSGVREWSHKSVERRNTKERRTERTFINANQREREESDVRDVWNKKITERSCTTDDTSLQV